MINLAIKHIVSCLNQFLKMQFELSEDIVVVSNIAEQDGSVVPHIENKIVVFLVNIEKDTTPGCRPRTPSAAYDKATVSALPIHLNLYFMFSAHFSGKNYTEALKFLSVTVEYFQKNPIFNHQNSPDLDNRIAKLVLDMENLNFKDLSSLWSVINGKYLPSVLYKVRMITYDGQDVKAQIPTLKEPRASVSN